MKGKKKSKKKRLDGRFIRQRLLNICIKDAQKLKEEIEKVNKMIYGHNVNNKEVENLKDTKREFGN